MSNVLKMPSKGTPPEKPVPYSGEDEAALIAACVARPDDAMPQVARLAPSDFYFDKYAHVYAVLLALFTNRKSININSITRELKARGKAEELGGADFWRELARIGGHKVAHVADYAAAVERASTLRKLITTGGQIAALGYETGIEDDRALEQAGRLLMAVSARQGQAQQSDAPTAVSMWRTQLEETLSMEPGQVPGLRSGFPDLDRMLGGLKDGKLYIFAARPMVGKSSFAGQVAKQACMDKKRVLIFSLEMSTEEYVNRWVSDIAEINGQHLENGNITDAELARAAQAEGLIYNWPFSIDESGGLSITELSNRARAYAMRHNGVDLIVVDHIQLMNGGTRENRNVDLGAVTYGLKMLAKELDVPVLALSQLNRAVESRADHEPTMADLRESGNLEQDADVIAFLYREELYGATEQNRGQATLTVKKHRGGPRGPVNLTFQGEYTRFLSVAQREYMG